MRDRCVAEVVQPGVLPARVPGGAAAGSRSSRAQLIDRALGRDAEVNDRAWDVQNRRVCGARSAKVPMTPKLIKNGLGCGLRSGRPTVLDSLLKQNIAVLAASILGALIVIAGTGHGPCPATSDRTVGCGHGTRMIEALRFPSGRWTRSSRSTSRGPPRGRRAGVLIAIPPEDANMQPAGLSRYFLRVLSDRTGFDVRRCSSTQGPRLAHEHGRSALCCRSEPCPRPTLLPVWQLLPGSPCSPLLSAASRFNDGLPLPLRRLEESCRSHVQSVRCLMTMISRVPGKSRRCPAR